MTLSKLDEATYLWKSDTPPEAHEQGMELIMSLADIPLCHGCDEHDDHLLRTVELALKLAGHRVANQTLTHVQALHLLVILIEGGILSAAEDGLDRVRASIIAFADTESGAMARVVRQVGIRALNLPGWMAEAVEDATFLPCRCFVATIEAAARNVQPMALWAPIVDLGFVIYQWPS